MTSPSKPWILYFHLPVFTLSGSPISAFENFLGLRRSYIHLFQLGAVLLFTGVRGKELSLGNKPLSPVGSARLIIFTFSMVSQASCTANEPTHISCTRSAMSRPVDAATLLKFQGVPRATIFCKCTTKFELRPLCHASHVVSRKQCLVLTTASTPGHFTTHTVFFPLTIISR